MKYNAFPGTGENISVIGLGTWVMGGESWGGADEADSREAILRAIALGINFIDTAPAYGEGVSEEIIGEAIKGQREKVFLATKCGLVRDNGRLRIDLGPASIAREVDNSRRRLNIDTVDLYQCHWPDKNVPVEKTMEAMLKLQQDKKIKHIGVCNFDVPLLQKALSVAPVVTCQVQFSLLDRGVEKELLSFCREKGIGVIAYGVMGGGILTGKYQKTPTFDKKDARSMFYRYYQDARFQNIQKGVEKLKQFERPLGQLAINWVRQAGVMTALAGCRNAAQVYENAVAADWELTTDELQEISRITFA